MAFLNFFSALATNIPEPGGLWEILLFKVFDFVSHYGWRVIVFTICLKLVLSPLDIFQRVKMRKNQKITERIKPEMEKLQQQYGSNKQVLSQKQMELNKKEGFSYFSACLPMILTLVIFITLFNGLRNMSQYKSMEQYLYMYDAYSQTYDVEMKAAGFDFTSTGRDGNKMLDKDGNEYFDYVLNADGELRVDYTTGTAEQAEQAYKNASVSAAVSKAQDEVVKVYNEELKVGFFWIKNIWSPDVPWKKPILDQKEFETGLGNYATKPEKSGLTTGQLSTAIKDYSIVTLKLYKDPSNKTNGFLVLPILSVGLSFLSQFITTRQQKKSGQTAGEGTTAASSMKIMMWMMPIMMGFFAIGYTSVFTIYIITNSATTLLINLGTSFLLTQLDKRNFDKTEVVKERSEGRKAKKEKGSAEVIVRYGRPDPNDKNKKE